MYYGMYVIMYFGSDMYYGLCIVDIMICIMHYAVFGAELYILLYSILCNLEIFYLVPLL